MHFRMQVKHASIHLRNGKSAIQSQERMRHCGALQLMGLPFRCMVTTFPMTDAEEVNPSPIQIAIPSGDIAGWDYFCNTVQDILAGKGLK